MKELKNTAISSFLGFFFISIGFTCILINWTAICNDLNLIGYVMLYFNLFDLFVLIHLVAINIFLMSEGFAFIDISGFVEAITGPTITLMGVGIAIIIGGIICILVSIGNSSKLDKNKGIFTGLFTFLALYSLFNCIICGIGIIEVNTRRSLIYNMEILEWFVFDFDVELFLEIDFLGICAAFAAPNSPMVYIGLTSLMVSAILLFISCVYLRVEYNKIPKPKVSRVTRYPSYTAPGTYPRENVRNKVGDQQLKVFKCPNCQRLIFTKEVIIICPYCNEFLMNF